MVLYLDGALHICHISNISKMLFQERYELGKYLSFCNEECYFNFVMRHINLEQGPNEKPIRNLEDLREWQMSNIPGMKPKPKPVIEDLPKEKDEPYKNRGKVYKHFNSTAATSEKLSKRK